MIDNAVRDVRARWENDQAFVAPRFHKTLAQVLHMDGSWLGGQGVGQLDQPGTKPHGGPPDERRVGDDGVCRP
jgi:hypothetical protein